MSQVETPTPGGENVNAPGASNVPNIGKNLFWDDVRIGLNVVSVGVLILLAGAIAGPWLFPGWVVAVVVLVGGLATVMGLKISAAIPPESRVSLPALGAFGAALLCFLMVVVNYFMGWAWFELLVAALVLGGVAHVLFAIELNGCVKFMDHKWLTTLTQVYILVAAVYSLALIVYLLSPLAEVVTLQVFLQVFTLLVGALLLYLVSGASTALQRAQQGLPVEGPPVAAEETEESEEERRERASLAFKPVPPPEEFQFSKNDVDGFVAQDSTAGKAIVALMTGVFSVGVILYTIIALMSAF